MPNPTEAQIKRAREVWTQAVDAYDERLFGIPSPITAKDREAAHTAAALVIAQALSEADRLIEAVPGIWRNGITNTAIVIDLARKKHAAALRRNKAFAAFDRDLNEALNAWFRITRSASPETYEEAEQVWKDYLALQETTHAG